MPPSNSYARREETAYDHQLLAATRAGDPRAFRLLVERYESRAFAIAVSLVRDENDARDIVQEAFLRVHQNLSKFTGESSFFTWFYRILTNLCIDLLRKPGRCLVNFDASNITEFASSYDAETFDVASMGAAEHLDPTDTLHRRELAKKLMAALDDLPIYHRTVILLREVEGMSYEEIAEATGISKGTVMSRLFHARQKLQRTLRDIYVENRGTTAHLSRDFS